MEASDCVRVLHFRRHGSRRILIVPSVSAIWVEYVYLHIPTECKCLQKRVEKMENS